MPNKTLLLIATSLCVPWLAVAQGADDVNMASYRHASACVAVLRGEVDAQVLRHRAGQSANEADMVRMTEQAFAFIGTAYKSGLRKPEADVLLAEAERAQKSQSAESLRALSASCQAEGGRLLADSNVFERALASNRAKAKVDKQLAGGAGH